VLAAQSLQDPLAFLELDEVFTPPLRESEQFRDAFAQAAGSLAELGPLGAIERLA
jgi:mannitol-1-phosphate/altronate dehydrogenase